MNQHYESEIASVTRRLTESHLSSMRASAIGGASVSTAIVLLLLQTGVDSTALRLALYSASLAVPAWIAAWQFIEAYSLYGRDSYSHFSSVRGSGLAVGLAAIGMGCLATSLSSIIWHLAPMAAAIFIAASVFAAVLIFRHNYAVKAVADGADKTSGV
ncbi:hypothetical protein [Rhodanobacter soli]|uniref:hypothetical protein n=1 Tax=Rhodanobacter soli TaxID=590609 RepID=UPI0031D01D12